ncbi:radical SAM protein [Elusimicrobiota bacterium]
MDPHRYIHKYFPDLGINKKREAARLLYEISKRDGASLESILPPRKYDQYKQIKDRLIQRRYPRTFLDAKTGSFYLPKLEIKPENKADTTRPLFNPRKIIIEDSVCRGALAIRMKRAFPKAKVMLIKSAGNLFNNKNFSIRDYNLRAKTLFIIRETSDFYKPCPCTKKAFGCGYNVMNLGFGCPYECAYCYLQEYQNVPGIILPANLDDFFSTFNKSELNKGIFKTPRLGTGEFSDSLVFDHITGFSTQLIEFFKKYPNVTFEFKTKSTNIGNILKSDAASNIVISWSINTPHIIKTIEHLTPALKARLKSAQQCAQAGYKVGFHFDPVIYYKNWEKDYCKTIDLLFDSVGPKHIAWISIGTLRFFPALKKIIENRFPESKMLDEEMLLGFDGKMRYDERLRRVIYSKMLGWIKKRAKNVPVYLCMEDRGCARLSANPLW